MNFTNSLLEIFRSLRSPKLNFPTYDADLMADHHVMRQRDKAGPETPTKEGEQEKVNGTNSGATSEGEIRNILTIEHFFVYKEAFF